MNGVGPLQVSTSTVCVLHRSVTINAEFARFIAALEDTLGHLPADIQHDISERPQRARERIEAAQGAEELIIFSMLDHGAALGMLGAPRNARQYLIGNPLTAIEMSRHDVRAALYAPLRVLVYAEQAQQLVVAYDQPSSLFGQFGQEEVTRVALSLDVKLERALARAAELARRSPAAG